MADIVMTVLETLQIAVNNILVWVTVRPEPGIVKEISNAYFHPHNISRDNIQQNNIQNLNHLAKDSKGPRSRLALFEEGLIP